MPTATFRNTGPVTEHSTATVSYGNQHSLPTRRSSDLFKYSYDFNNDGTFELTDVSSNSAVVPASYLDDGPHTYTVKGRIKDKDGGYTDYTTGKIGRTSGRART